MPSSINIDEYISFFNKWMPYYGITTTERIWHFLAQIAHESNQLKTVIENLNYSEQGLLSTWPTRFTKETAKNYARKPENIANKVYANRMGNGDEKSGDGWRNRGMGLIQCTGADIRSEMIKDWKISIPENELWLSTPEYAVRSACWFWWKKGLNKKVDSGATVEDVTEIVNGGKNGLKERIEFYNRAKNIIK